MLNASLSPLLKTTYRYIFSIPVVCSCKLCKLKLSLSVSNIFYMYLKHLDVIKMILHWVDYYSKRYGKLKNDL